MNPRIITIPTAGGSVEIREGAGWGECCCCARAGGALVEIRFDVGDRIAGDLWCGDCIGTALGVWLAQTGRLTAEALVGA